MFKMLIATTKSLILTHCTYYHLSPSWLPNNITLRMPFPSSTYPAGLPWWRSGKESAWQCKRCGFDPCVGTLPLEKEVATHSSILAWAISQTEEPSRPQSTKSQRVGHDWATKPRPSCVCIYIYTHTHTYIFLFRFFSSIVNYKTLNIAPCAIQ